MGRHGRPAFQAMSSGARSAGHSTSPGAQRGMATIGMFRSSYCLFRLASPLNRQLALSSLRAAGGTDHSADALLLRRWLSSDDGQVSGGSWMPGWLRSKMPGALGGSLEEEKLKNMSLDDFRKQLAMARRVGGLTGMVGGNTAARDPVARGIMKQFEDIIDAMTPEERANPDGLFDVAARQRVAVQVGCKVSQVDDCIARFLWTKSMLTRMADIKRAGGRVPATMEEAERTLGSWQAFKKHSPAAGGGVKAGNIQVPMTAKGPRGEPCPFAGGHASRSTKCPLTGKQFKRCCGK